MAPSRGFDHGMVLMGLSRRICRVNTISRAQQRYLCNTTCLQSGHNRWSKIKHDKAKEDASKNKARSVFAQEIATASRLFGGDPASNPRLADLIVKAKREGFAKSSIEAAIARGQGRSVSGNSLESVTIEAILHSVGIIIECETDSKGRTLQQVKMAIKNAGGSAAPANFLFSKTGRIVLEEKEGVTAEDVLDAALEAGAKDVEDMMVLAEPEETTAVGEAISKGLGMQISTSEVVWVPVSDTIVDLNPDIALDLCNLVDDIHEKDNSVQSIAMNVGRGSVDDETWAALQDRLV